MSDDEEMISEDIKKVSLSILRVLEMEAFLLEKRYPTAERLVMAGLSRAVVGMAIELKWDEEEWQNYLALLDKSFKEVSNA